MLLYFYSISTSLKVLFENLVPQYITLPTYEEAQEEAHLFHAASSFPPIVWGAIDGTHVLVSPPSSQETAFRNRHHSLSLNVMIVAGASGRISAVCSSMPGSNHDSRIFEQSHLFYLLNVLNWRPCPNFIVIADSAYKGTHRFLATPYLDGVAAGDPRKEEYNVCFRRARTKIEQTIGRVKNKFPVLSNGIRFKSMKKNAQMVQVRQNKCAHLIGLWGLKFYEKSY
jgi:hypothetical protein